MKIWTPVQNLEAGLVPSVRKINGEGEQRKEQQKKEENWETAQLRKKQKANECGFIHV